MSSKIFVKIHAVLRKLWSCAQLPMCPIAHVAHCPCAPSDMCPIPQGTSSLSSILTMIPLCPCPIADMSKKDVKLSKRCQVVKKMSNVKKSNTWTMKEVHKKNKLTHILMSILTSHMMVTKNPQNVHRKCFWTFSVTFIFDIKIDINTYEPHYVNLFFLWTSSIVHVFDFLTFDIFLTTWHLFDNLTSFLDIWAIAHMGNGTFWYLFQSGKFLLFPTFEDFSYFFLSRGQIPTFSHISIFI